MEQIFTCITNIAMFGIFAKLAMYFNHWWIIIFGLLAISTYKRIRFVPYDENDEQDNDQDNDHE